VLPLQKNTKVHERGVKMIKIDTEKCTGCGGCIDLCPQIAIAMIDDVVTVDEETCSECKICVKVCPMRAPQEVEK
jgi:NAD-dependent dihydropyrimidine dehydrogenase PreA subunit